MVSVRQERSNESAVYNRRFWQATLACSLVLGTLFAIYTPVNKSPDEYSHFLRAYQCSKGRRYAHKVGDAVGYTLPESLETAILPVEGHWSWSTDNAFTVPLAPGNRKFLSYPNTALYTPVPYLPAAATIAIGRKMHLTPLLLFYGGRLSNVLAYAILTTFAMRWMPIQKATLFLLMLMPLPLFLAGTLSADVVTNGASFLAIAMVLHYAVLAERVTARQVAGLALVFSAITLSKQAYCPLVLLFLLIPARKLGTRRQWLMAAAVAMVVPVLLDLAWCLSIKSLYIPLRPGVQPAQQFWHIVNHPWDFAVMLWNVMTKHDVFLCRATMSILTLEPGSVYFLYFAAILVSAILNNNDAVTLGASTRLIPLAICLLELFTIAALIYMSWTAVGRGRIVGLQSRYFLPLLPLVFLPLQGLGVAVFRKPLGRRLACWAPYWESLMVVFGAVAAIYSLAERYYSYYFHTLS